MNQIQIPEDSRQVSKIRCSNPATGEYLGEVPVMSRTDVIEAIGRARTAQRAWGQTSFAERRRVLRLLLDSILQKIDSIVEMVSRESGKTRETAMVGEIWPVVEKLRWTIAHGEKHLRPERVSSGVLVHKKATVEFQPLGVVGNIAPWNFPFQNILGPTIAALFAGNAVLTKVSEWSSWSTGPIKRIIDEVLNARGHSPDLVQLLTGYGDTGAALVSGGVDLVIFTGSARNGRRVIEESAKAAIPVILELGGKDPMIVLDDADIEQAVHTALLGAFLGSGQMCMALERIYVCEPVYDAFVNRVLEVASQLRQGPPGADIVDIGAMTMPGQVDIVERLVNDAVRKGAVVRLGGKRAAHGQFFEPTILTNVDHSMDVMREETFGPVMNICRVANEEEAIRLANDSEYGLSSSIFTRDRARAARVARRLVAGSSVVNDFGLAYLAQALPFGGARGSGFGRLNGRDGLRACTNQKAYLEDRFPITTPNRLFPIQQGTYELSRSVLRLGYGGWKERSFALAGLVDSLKSRIWGNGRR
jgi:acyl-CoA reductase-like NAD-dependent aldehyde dehydrogenase